MKKIFWLTGSSFFDVDERIVPVLNKEYDIFWFILRQKESFFTKEDISNYMVQTKVKGIVVDWPKLRSVQSLYMYYKLAKRIKQERFDLMYINFLGLPYMFPLFHLLSVDKRKLIYACHDFVDHMNIKSRGFISKYKMFIFRHFNHIQLFSKTQQMLFSEIYANNTFYAPLSLKGFGKPTTNKKIESLVFLFFGKIQQRKGVEYLVKAGNIVNKKYKGKFTIRICGACDEWEYYQNMIEDRSCFELEIRRIENDEIPNIFNCADYLVLPYKDVTQSGPLFISYYYELPVIASNHAGFKEYIEHGKNGFLFENENSNDLACIMERIIEGRYDYPVVKTNLHTFIEKNISLDSIIHKYKESFDKIMLSNG